MDNTQTHTHKHTIVLIKYKLISLIYFTQLSSHVTDSPEWSLGDPHIVLRSHTSIAAYTLNTETLF
jgi:hypothetical protein